eukprot:gnl/Dysnectes_brevis/5852_a8691_374.p1 GENE.gnl/Dysnectes_brevis/5852_a8691_374~~gnl/Dysnectes_brevis/5852_a8691_374.p1  ORF type:complete len:237 (+),score=85.67 gnl/Dysnectes_brevis/5852_a8691_374:28-711(+)
MQTDPFLLAEGEVNNSLQSITRETNAFIKTLNESKLFTEDMDRRVQTLTDSIKGVEYDLNDMQTAISVIHTQRTRFPGVDDAELARRASFVGDGLSGVSTLREQLDAASMSAQARHPLQGREQNLELEMARVDQDVRIDDIEDRVVDLAEPLRRIRRDAQQFGRGLDAEAELLDEFGNEIDQAADHAQDATGQVKELRKRLAKNKDCGFFCLSITMLIVLILLNLFG